MRESVEIIRENGATPAGVIIALDRQEKGQQDRSAIDEVKADYGIPVASIVRLEELITYLSEKSDSADALTRIQSYREQYGV